MEEYKVIIDSNAEKDLISILSYISNSLKEPQIAKRIFQFIRKQVLSLNQLPYRFEVINEEPYTSMGIRKIPVENYTAFYYIDEENKTVHVFRILYNRHEWQNLI